MLLAGVTALLIGSANAPSDINAEFGIFGAPNSKKRSFEVNCADQIYSFNFSVVEGETAIQFDRKPKAPSDGLQADMIDILAQFYDAPKIDASCRRASSRHPSGVLLLEIEGPNKASLLDASAACLQREGLFDWESLWILIIEGESVRVLRDEIGQCVTKDDIDELNRLQRKQKK